MGSKGSRAGWPPWAWIGIALAVLAIPIAAGTVARAGDDKDPKKKLLAKADDIAQQVSKIRGLKIKRSIERGVMDKDEIRKRVLERMDQEYKPEELAAEELAMKRMGMLAASVDYKKMVIDVLTDEIAGFYDPWERRLYIAGWQPAQGMDDGVMAHEIDHALQDQHFDLRGFMKDVRANSDASSARQALVEGDGMALMVEFMMPSLSPWSDDRVLRMMNANVSASNGSGSLAKAPLILQVGMVFPYTHGLAFVAYFRKQHSWRRIDSIFKKPPLATEHILHPTKYETYERPDDIKPSTPDALSTYKAAYDNVSGELGLQVFLRQHGQDTGKAEIAAEGWGGDRLVVYTPPGHDGAVDTAVAVQYTVWDHDVDAMEFYDSAVDALATLSGGTAREGGSETLASYTGADGTVTSVERKGDSVLMIVGAPAASADAVRVQVWSGWKVRRR